MQEPACDGDASRKRTPTADWRVEPGSEGSFGVATDAVAI